MSSAGYYSYLQVEDEEDGVFYQFITDHHIGYTVYFKLDEYSGFVNNFPLLLKKGYAFGFRQQKFDAPVKNVNDPLVLSTIYQIVFDFFENYGNDAILLYHCDIADSRQSHRNRLFNNWEKRVVASDLVCKYSVEIQIGSQDFYLGFISLVENPLLEEIKMEFEAFSYFIIQPK